MQTASAKSSSAGVSEQQKYSNDFFRKQRAFFSLSLSLSMTLDCKSKNEKPATSFDHALDFMGTIGCWYVVATGHLMFNGDIVLEGEDGAERQYRSFYVWIPELFTGSSTQFVKNHV